MTTQEQIVHLEQVLLQAMLKSDVEELDALISDELIFTDHTGRIVSKTTDIEAHRSGKIHIESIDPGEQLIKIYDKVAIVSVLTKIKGNYFGQSYEGKIRFTRVWMDINHSWKIVAGHTTLVND